jgi:transglutaminase-like putative cysteine protease
MDRRDFLRWTALAPAGLAVPAWIPDAFAEDAAPAAAPWRMFEVTTQVEVLKPAGVTRVWLPTPLTQDTPFLKAMGNSFDAQGGSTRYAEDPAYAAGMVYAEWPEGVKPVLTLKSRFATRDIAVDFSKPGNPHPESIATLARFTAASEHVPTTGAVKDLSSSIVKGKSGDVEKAHAIYEWIVENTYRDPKTRGCGTGDINFMIDNHVLGGKCADLNALFVALARSEGIPARDVYGIRVADSRLGYKSLGKGGDITKGQHCRAEFYSQAHGWVPVDPADVRKVMLEESGGKAIDDPMVVAARKRLFGSWEMNWLAYNYANDVKLPQSQHGKIAFLMYPQSETAVERLDSLDPDHFKYTITSREMT